MTYSRFIELMDMGKDHNYYYAEQSVPLELLADLVSPKYGEAFKDEA